MAERKRPEAWRSRKRRARVGPVGRHARSASDSRDRHRRGDSRRGPRGRPLRRAPSPGGRSRWLSVRHAPAFAARRRQLLDCAALLIAAQKVHARVRAGGVAPEHMFDQADRLHGTRQSSVAQSRRLVTALATETWATPWRWALAPLIVSSAVVCLDARSSSTAARTDDSRSPDPRTRGALLTMYAGLAPAGSVPALPALRPATTGWPHRGRCARPAPRRAGAGSR